MDVPDFSCLWAHLNTVYHLQAPNAISDRFKWDFPHYLTMCCGGLLWRSSRNSQPGGEANLTQDAAQLSQPDFGKGGGFTVCLWFKDGHWLKFLRQKQWHETHREKEKKKKGWVGGETEQDSPAFLSSLVSDCTDSTTLPPHRCCCCRLAANTWQPYVWISEDNMCY